MPLQRLRVSRRVVQSPWFCAVIFPVWPRFFDVCISLSTHISLLTVFLSSDYAGWADKVQGDSFAPDDGFYKIVEQKPLGVCAAITSWNASLHFLAWKVAPALALGNTVVIKPSEKSPLGTLAFGSLVQAAGLPPGVVNIVAGKVLVYYLLFRE